MSLLLPPFQHVYRNNHTTYTQWRTRDNSPTLSMGEEKMHNSAGAFDETLCIYMPIPAFVFQNKPPWRFLSVGLGIGYNEFLTVAYSLAHQKPLQLMEIISTEIDPELQSQFINFINNRFTHPFFKSIYLEIMDLFSSYFNISLNDFRAALKELYEMGGFVFPGPLGNDKMVYFHKFNGIYFDAFSKTTSPQLWELSFLSNFLEKNCAKECAFASYASRTDLKKALKQNTFELQKRAGFSGKREATFATRI